MDISAEGAFLNSKGFLVGTSEYRNCVMNKGRKN